MHTSSLMRPLVMLVKEVGEEPTQGERSWPKSGREGVKEGETL